MGWCCKRETSQLVSLVALKGKARQGSTATATRFVEFQNLQQNLEMSSSIGFLTEEQWRLMRSASYGQDSMPEESSKLMWSASHGRHTMPEVTLVGAAVTGTVPRRKWWAWWKSILLWMMSWAWHWIYTLWDPPTITIILWRNLCRWHLIAMIGRKRWHPCCFLHCM